MVNEKRKTNLGVEDKNEKNAGVGATSSYEEA
jgi:hypothetical protein